MKFKIAIVFIYFFSNGVFSQETDDSKDRSSLRIVFHIGHQDDLFKFVNATENKYHDIKWRPSFTAGIQKTWSQGSRFRLYQDVVASYHIHPYQERTLGIGTDLGFQWTFFKKIIFNPKLGLHYNYARYADIQYAYVNDKWVKTDNSYEPSHRANIKLGFETGYHLSPKTDIVVGASAMALTPYAKDVLNLFLSNSIYTGLRYRL